MAALQLSGGGMKKWPHKSSAMAHSSFDCLRDITNGNEEGNLPVLYTSLLDCSVNRGKDTQYHSLVRRLCGPNCSEHTATLASYNRTCHNHSGKVSREYVPEGESRANQTEPKVLYYSVRQIRLLYDAPNARCGMHSKKADNFLGTK